MITGRKIVGCVAMTLGIVGTLLSIGALITTWMIKQPVLEKSEAVFQNLNNSLLFAVDKVDQGKDAVVVIQQQTREVSQFVEKVANNVNAKNAEDLQKMQKKIDVQIQIAKLVLKACGVKINPIGKSFRLVDEAPLLTTGQELDDPGLATRVQEASQKTDEAERKSNQLGEELDTILKSLQNGENVKEKLMRVNVLGKELHQDISDAGDRLNLASDRLQLATEKLAKLREAFPGWWSRVVILVTVLLVWITIAQVCLAMCGRALLRTNTGESPSAEPR